MGLDKKCCFRAPLCQLFLGDYPYRVKKSAGEQIGPNRLVLDGSYSGIAVCDIRIPAHLDARAILAKTAPGAAVRDVRAAEEQKKGRSMPPFW